MIFVFTELLLFSMRHPNVVRELTLSHGEDRIVELDFLSIATSSLLQLQLLRTSGQPSAETWRLDF